MADQLTHEQLDILKATTTLSKEKIIENYLSFKRMINANGLVDRKSFTEFYLKLLPKKGNSEQFCKFIFESKC